MATTWGPTKAGAAAATTSSGLGAGNGPHIPVGTWSGTRYRSAVRFQDPPWSAWTKIVSATLKLKTTDFAHVGPRNSTIFVKRTTVANLWLLGSGAQDCNNGFSASNTTQYSDLNPTATDAKSFSSGTAENSWKSIDVTAMVAYYFANKVSSLTFILDQQDSSDYAEFWSDDKSGGEPTLTIVYEDKTVPNAPTLVAPADKAINQPLTPVFSWTHDATDGPQLGAEVHWLESDGPTLKTTIVVTGAASSASPAVPIDPAIGINYQWQVRTQNAQGWSAYSAYRTFSVPAPASINISPDRQMVWDDVSKAPRLFITCTPNFAFTEVRVQTSTGYDSNWGPGSMSFMLPVALTNGTAITVTVSIRDATGKTATDSQAFTPRWGLTTHRRDLTAAPNAWQSAVVSSVKPVGTDLKMEYGADPAAIAAPTDGWHDDISDCPLARYVFWRAWFLPSATAGPTLDKVTIQSTSGAAQTLDKWGMNRADPAAIPPVPQTAMAAPWTVSTSEYVYGSRSAQCNVAGAGPYFLYSLPIVLRGGRSYILTGLMKSTGNSGAQIMLVDDTGAVLMTDEVTPQAVQTAKLIDPLGTLFYNDRFDVNRYKSPVYKVGGADKTVWVALRTGGTAGTRAYFDAIKVEESTVATAWSPGALGASIVDAGGVQIDASKGGVFRLRGSLDPDTSPRGVVDLYQKGLRFGGDTELESPSVGVLAVNGMTIRMGPRVPPVPRIYTATGTVAWAKPANLSHIIVEVMGGGGAGGGAPGAGSGNAAGSGGGAGAYARHLYTAEELTLASYNVTVGIAGVGGNGAGGAGGNSAFVGPGAQLMGTGGSGGIVGTNSTGNITTGGAPGGVASGPPGAFLADGASGMRGTVRGGAYVPTGNGASSFIGGGGNAGAGGGGEVGQAKGSGGGGAAANTVTFAGGAGAAGLVIVTEYYL